MATAKFTGKSCPLCGAEFIPGETQIQPHPEMHGPQGGKVWVCESHVQGGAMQNPRAYKKGGGKYKQTAQSVQAQLRHQNLLEDISQSELGGYEYALAGRAPTRKFQKVANPFSNAGRRTLKQAQKPGRLPRLAAAASCDYSAMPVGTYDKSTKTFSGGLVGMAQKGDAGAAAELSRRGRGSDGMKLAWQKKAAGVRKAANNPFGF